MIEIYPWSGDSDKDDPRQGGDSNKHNLLSESSESARGEALGNHIDWCIIKI